LDTFLSLSYLEGRLKSLPEVKASMTSSLGSLIQQEHALARELSTIGLSREFQKKAISVIYERSIGEISNTLNEALSYVYHDCNYKVRLELEDKRSNKQLEIVVEDHSYSPPLELDIKDGVGAGIRAVISFTLYIYFLVSKGAYPLLLLDESYSSVSNAYKERFFTFVSNLSKAKGFSTVFITHTTEALDYADNVYFINDGHITDGRGE
jgi:DNA repair exonuclease SbcCD ATPase subunit